MITKRKYTWIGQQNWSNILFLHWAVDPDRIRPLLPPVFQLDLFEDKAWVSIVLFEAYETKGRMMPHFTRLPSFHQMNIRTYVKYKDTEEVGVYFLKIYADSFPFSFGAKKIFRLPFHPATFSKNSPSHIEVRGSNKEELLSVEYTSNENVLPESTLRTFLTERYCIWNKKGNTIIKLPILHKKWRLEQVTANVQTQFLLPFLTMQPVLAHYSRYKQTILFPYERKGSI